MSETPETRPCRNPTCRRPVRVDLAVQGYGEQCARERGLLGSTVDVGQDGPDLLDMLADMALPGDASQTSHAGVAHSPSCTTP